ncbi:MAG: hypothetical protein GWO24_33995, partial [Akkermansiaceae bacterium]|nr:hypothetical protein [Akkermansiaceae bacterium]
MKTHAPRAFLALLLIAPCSLPATAGSPVQHSIPDLIDQLVEVDSLRTFYAGTFQFKEFPPLEADPLDASPPSPDASAAESAFQALTRLVERGPEALPYLLGHLTDERGTKTIVTDDFAVSMGLSTFIDYRRGNPRELAMLEDAGLPAENPGPDFDGVLEDYTLSVGDMCFTLIGMITNRSYYVLVDEFDAQLSSPTQSEPIATGVMVKWGPAPEPLDLYEQLKSDLESGDPRFSPSAATRLLYYFPGISDQLVIARLGKLLAAHQPGNDSLANYLEAISWSSHPRLMSTLRRFLQTATDPSQIAAAARVYRTTPDPRG